MGDNYISCTTRLYLGPLLFNIFLCDLFLVYEDCCFTNYAGNATTYVTGINTAELTENLTSITKKQESNENKP